MERGGGNPPSLLPRQQKEKMHETDELEILEN